MANIAILITTTGWGGLEMNVLKLAIGLSELNHSVTLLTASNSKLAAESKGKINDLIEIKVPKKYFDFKMAKQLGVIFKSKNKDAVIIPDNRDLDVIAWTKRLYYKKVKVFYHQNMQIGINKRDLIHTWRFKAIDSWITPLDWLKTEVENNTRFPSKRIKIIPIGTQIDRFIHNPLSKTEARKKLSIDTQNPLIGIIGRISQKKGQEFVIEAISELQEAKIKVDVLIFGSATINDPECQAYEKRIKKLVKDKNISQFVHFREFSPDIELFYSAVDIFTIASESETYGMVTIEAMLSELPIIAANTGGSPEILENGKLGRLYNYNMLKDYTEQVEWVLLNPKESKTMASLAKEKALHEYSHLTEIQRIAELIEKSI